MGSDIDTLISTMAQSLRALLQAQRIEAPCMVGIHTGGVWIAQRLHALLELEQPLGSLDISFYRDDFTRIGMNPQVQPSNLQFEILETSALQDMQQVTAAILACQRIGIDFALDDFGTGYSSLTYLRQLPVAVLKIDQSFVRNLLEDSEDQAILRGVVGLAQAFGREVIAEGVESDAQGALLLQMGCDAAQGFGIARPMEGDAVAAWLQDWRPRAQWLQP